MLTSDEYAALLSAASTPVVNLPKREDCPRTKHDVAAFSGWKPLVGRDDWKEYSVAKEGAERYRTHNLPDCKCCPGVYELGIVASHSGSGKPYLRYTKPVYVGQTDNVRNRLQQYGRDGNHLENMFTEAFSKGFSVMYRWAPMKSKEDADKTEAALLKTYNYSWNKVRNGERRGDDVVVSKAKTPSAAIRKLQKGFRIKAPEPPDDLPAVAEKKERGHYYVHGPIIECGSSSSNGYNNKQIKSLEKLIIVKNTYTICGFGLSNGTFCTEKPPQGRKRCEEHKGLRIKDSSSISQIPESSGSRKYKGDGNTVNGSATFCGATLKDGTSCCSRKPAEGSRRCWQHNNNNGITAGSSSSPTSNFKALPSACGAPTLTGYSCNRQPAVGSTRCWQHVGKSSDYYLSSPRPLSYSSSYGSLYRSRSSTCGAMTQKGYPCSRSAAAGGSRCWQHGG